MNETVFKDARTGFYFRGNLKEVIEIVEDAVVYGWRYTTLYAALGLKLPIPGQFLQEETVGNINVIARIDKAFGDVIYVIE